MNMHIKSEPKALNEKTIEFLKKIKSSKGSLSTANVKTLIEDFQRLGDADFFLEVNKALATKPAKPKIKKDESLLKLEELADYASLKARLFADLTLEKAEEQGLKLPKLPSKDRTLPKLLTHFRVYLSEGELFRIGQMVAAKHTRTH